MAAGIVLLLVGALAFPLVKDQAAPIVSHWYQRRAHERYMANDLAGALAEIDGAISWQDERAELYYERGVYRLDDHESEGHVEASLDDFEEAIRIDAGIGHFYIGRSQALLRLRRYRKAIDDINRSMKIDSPDAGKLNYRAYVRALGRIELEQGLADVEEAIRRAGPRIAAYLDTRGYLLYLLGQLDRARKDLDQAVVLAENDRRAERRRLEAWDVEPSQRAFRMRRHDHDLAVLYHHRGLIHRKLGDEQQARADLDRGNDLGYDPKKGVW